VPTVLDVPEGGWPAVDVALAFGKTLAPEALRAISVWLDRLAEWNAKMDLTAARSPGELVDLMLADALVLAQNVPDGARVVDIGTGAGAPGLALAILRPDVAVTLVEPMAKRTSFLRVVLAEIGLARKVDVLRTRGDALADTKPAFDVALSRATLAPGVWAPLGARLVRPGGAVWVLLAKEDAPDVAGLERQESVEYAWPNTGARRRAVRYMRTGD
jgi:16S rRNA (guanine527-N7)-methyltransferase